MWDVVEESRREVWSFTPFEHVGPLRFGMTHERAAAAVDGVLKTIVSQGDGTGWVSQADMWPVHYGAGAGVHLYYDRAIGLAAIAIDARMGPQVDLDGIPLVGRVPSLLEDALIDHLTAHSIEPAFSLEANPCAPDIGVVMRVQRAGDRVPTRPVLVARDWAPRCSDASEGRIPDDEWRRFS
ncbi:hypothetical protein B4N89_00090 [Embleya scabrispora]|uniref:Uncharacterized protein n=1 Tax=Embleya scabrispora TaxID=159449 RepID=A0A1T3P6H7_9ACTN|nr:hypothetical protein B4N89_47135 [Embleya scabrispora]OPC84708.1 hypothetical protein B4N89_00090 [Embleya scabrispora]